MEPCLMGKMLCPSLTQHQNQVRHCHCHQHHTHIEQHNKLQCVKLFGLVLDESGQDDGAAKANPSLTREKDLVVNISDLDNIFDEDEEELGVSVCTSVFYMKLLFYSCFGTH